MRALLALLVVTVASAAEPAPGLRFVYAYPRVGAVDLRLTGPDGARAEQLALSAPGVTPWLPLAWPQGELTIRPAGQTDGDPLITAPFAATGRATVIVLQPADEPKLLVLADAPPTVPPGQAAFRVVNALPGVSPVTLKPRRPTGQQPGELAEQKVAYGAVSQYQFVEAGLLALRAVRPDEEKPFDWELTSLRLLPGVAYTAVLMGLSSPGSDELPLTLLPLVDRLP
ncbi:MAG: DUF4397 domain-containing protein [Armatimonadetes bacterium]|nr:DUF4397 domain-containing protein [Armatimonadota bacterium]